MIVYSSEQEIVGQPPRDLPLFDFHSGTDLQVGISTKTHNYGESDIRKQKKKEARL